MRMKKDHYINYGGKDIAFPAVVKISFAPIFESLRKMTGDEDKATALYATTLLEDLKNYPELEEGFTDHTLVEKYEKPIAKLMRVIFPDALTNNEIKGVTAPFEFNPFFLSTRFKNIIKAAGEEYKHSVMDFSEDEMYIFACCVILGQYYHYNVDSGAPLKMSIPNVEQKITHIYRLAFNADMIKIVEAENAPAITQEDYAMLIERFNDIDLWKEKFPPGSYILSGIGIVNLMDVTTDHSIAGIATNLLSKSETTLSEIAENLRIIFLKPNLRVGYIDYENDSFSCGPEHKENHSILLNKMDQCSCSTSLCSYSYEQVIENKRPLVITDTEKFHEKSKSILSETLLKQAIGSYIIIPLIYEQELLGFMELASENKYELSLASLNKLEDVLPVLSMAVSNFKTEAKNELEAVIQREFTQIHPSVKWRFEEESAKYIASKHRNEEPVLNDLDFPNVFPLFGQLDIKGSSTIRNEVIQKDITTQLNAVKGIVRRAFHKKQLPLYEELSFRIGNYIKEINKGLQAGSEHDILHFLKKDVYPVFEHLKKTDKAISATIKKYEDLLDPQLNMIYDQRKKFDEAVAIINNVLTAHLDKRQVEAQQMFPHYFERYKTDGIEFNIYIGDSIAKGHVFDKIFVNNLRLWQLMVMSELENEFNVIKKNLQQPLEIASLIMVQSDPLAIHFRLDEKRFDVKGAYNARYEIIKSRIDKAYIKGTEERITAAGKLAIVYSNEQDATEYIKYLNFLTAKGYFINDSLEKLVLEDMQGITGLQALRIGLNYTTEIKENDKLSISQLMQAMENN
ncbi:MAG: GAF domain-containing protein [Ferruginibacter sp.]